MEIDDNNDDQWKVDNPTFAVINIKKKKKKKTRIANKLFDIYFVFLTWKYWTLMLWRIGFAFCNLLPVFNQSMPLQIS